MTKFLIDKLSVFFPAYNEEANIENTVNKTIPILKNIAQKWEIIIVNDGSKDKTKQKGNENSLNYKKKEWHILLTIEMCHHIMHPHT